MTDSRCQPHPRCAFAGCEMPGEPDSTIPCAYFCGIHWQWPRDVRVEMFQRAVLAREERDRAGL